MQLHHHRTVFVCHTRQGTCCCRPLKSKVGYIDRVKNRDTRDTVIHHRSSIIINRKSNIITEIIPLAVHKSHSRHAFLISHFVASVHHIFRFSTHHIAPNHSSTHHAIIHHVATHHSTATAYHTSAH